MYYIKIKFKTQHFFYQNEEGCGKRLKIPNYLKK